MIHIRSLRPVVKDGETYLSSGVYRCPLTATSVQELFKNIHKTIYKIPEKERWDLFYTTCHTDSGEAKEFGGIDVMWIDIDGIDKLVDAKEYISVVSEFLSIPAKDMGIVCSGNGYHFLIGLPKHMPYEEYFNKENKALYSAMCDNLSLSLFDAALPHKVDSSVFTKGRILRLPFTQNRKASGTTECVLLNSHIAPHEFDLLKLSEIPELDPEHSIGMAALKHFAEPQTEAVIGGCLFLQWCKENPNDVLEPQWYAMLSILARLIDGLELCHEFSMGYAKYSKRRTDVKIKHALASAGPRTCANISTIWEGCFECPNWGQCTSPITLKDKSISVSTENTGYWITKFNEKTGEEKLLKPDYEGLMAHFKRLHEFVTTDEGAMTYKWVETHWVDIQVRRMHEFVETHLDPKPMNSHCAEFSGKVQRNNVIALDFFANESTVGKINFLNGTLDTDTLELSPHSKEDGFRHVLPFEYDPTATCDRFIQFMREISCDDPDVIRLLLEFLGYCLGGVSAMVGQKALVLVGDGANGKSVFMDVLKHLAGEGNFAALSMGNEISKLENRYKLDGMLFNVSEETPTNAMMDNSIFKSMVTGGDIQARKLYCDSYTFKNNAKIVMACNELPTTDDMSHGMFRRLLIVPFNATFRESDTSYDPLIRDKLYAESTGIFNLILVALKRFKDKERFTKPEIVDRALGSYQLSNNSSLSWWEETYVQSSSTDFVIMQDAYFEYKLDMESEGIRPKAFATFCKSVRGEIRKKGGKIATINDKSSTRIFVEGHKKKVQVIYGFKEMEREDEIQTTALPASVSGDTYSTEDEAFGLVLGNGSRENRGDDQHTET